MGRRSRTKRAAKGSSKRRVESLHPIDKAQGLSLEQRIRQAMENKNTKSALGMAKQFHKTTQTPQSQQLLIEAYQARIKDMQDKGMGQEAKTLTDLVLERFPTSASCLHQTRLTLACEQGDLSGLIGALADPDLPGQQRRELEDLLRCQWVDLGKLSQTPELPKEHDLRQTAGALWQALVAVTSGPIAQLPDLREVARRSPLAPWKTLVRSLDALYRGDTETCRQSLRVLSPDSAPARLVPVVEALLGDAGDLEPAARSLVLRLQGEQGSLKDLLAQLDDAFGHGDQARILSLVKTALSCCRQACPDLEVPLMQRISIRCGLARIHADRVVSAMGGQARHDAAFWRLFARSYEADEVVFACALWEQFRHNAVAEGWFASDSPEVAFLYQHMAELLSRVPSEELQEVRYEFEYDYPVFDYFYLEGQPREIRDRIPDEDSYEDLYYLDIGQLYQRACALCPDAEVYRRWWDWSRREDLPAKQVDAVAEAWAEHDPNDTRPWLCLAESAEDRGAYTKALKFIMRAESLGSGDPKVQRARWRLWIHKCLDHLKANKPALADKDLVTLQKLPQATEPSNVVLQLALQWMTAIRNLEREQAEAIREQLQGRLEAPGATDLMLVAVYRRCVGYGIDHVDLDKRLSALKAGSAAGALIRIHPVIKGMPLTLYVPTAWKTGLERLVGRKKTDFDVTSLLDLGQVSLELGWDQLAYSCADHGLRAGDAEVARFLLMRAQSLVDGFRERRLECVAGAAELARRHRDMSLVAEIVDWVQGQGRWFGPLGPVVTIDDLSLDDEGLKKLLDFERNQRKYPKERWGWGKQSSLDEDPDDECQCPACQRRRRQEAAASRKPQPKPKPKPAPEPLLFEDCFDEPDLFEDDDEIGTGAPPPVEMLALMARLAQANGGRLPESGDDCIEILSRHPDLAEEVAGMMDLYPVPEDVIEPSVRRKHKKRKKRR